MSSTTLYRLSGLALMLALPILVAGWILHPRGEALPNLLDPLYPPAHFLMFVSWVFVLLGLPGLYARQAHRAGVLGLVGFALSLFIAGISFYLLLYEAFVSPRLAGEAAAQALVAPGGPLAHGAFASMGLFFPLLALAFLTSAPLLGLATLRAGVLPRAAGWLLILSTVPNVLSVAVPNVPAGWPIWLGLVALGTYAVALGYAWGGYALWAERERAPAAAAQPGMPQPAT